MTPKIKFKYSWIYDRNWHEWIKLYSSKKIDIQNPKQIMKYIEKVEKLWAKDQQKVLSELSLISGLKWQEKEILCYVVGKCRPFSDPLTLPVYKNDFNFFIDVLVHELIHQLFTQGNNMQLANKSWGKIAQKYKDQTILTQIHIILFAIHTQIYKKFFTEDRLARDIKDISEIPEYKKAWDIVHKDNYIEIIKQFKDNL